MSNTVSNNGVNSNPYTFNAVLNKSLNAIADASEYVVKKSMTIAAPTVLGYIGGWGMGVGTHLGLFYGLTSGLYHLTVISTGRKYIEKNEGRGPNDLHASAADFLRITGVISGIAVPIILTSLYGEKVMGTATSYFPKDGIVRWMIESTPTASYNWWRSVGVCAFPVAAQYWISSWREIDKEAKKHY